MPERPSIVPAMPAERNQRRMRKATARSGSRTQVRDPASGRKPTGFAFGPLNYGLFAAALASILAGYLLLARGSITAAPILLVFGYIVLIPAAFLAGLSGGHGGDSPPGES